jgi:Tfp pilus assembly PilM family ATPase
VIGMHAEPLAILRAFAHLYRSEADKARTTCFLDMGATTTKVVIAHGEKMMFAKAIHAAGDHLTRDRAALDRLNFEEARTLRMRETTPAPAAPPAHDEEVLAAVAGQAAGKSGFGGVATAVAPLTHAVPVTAGQSRNPPPAQGSETIDCIIDELQLCVRYHQNLFPDRPIEKLVFLGGESHHLANCQRIARALRIGAQLGDPMARMVRLNQLGETTGVNMRQPQPGWAVPLGLCLSEANL